MNPTLTKAVEAGARSIPGAIKNCPSTSTDTIQEVAALAVLRAALPVISAELERVVQDDDGHFTVWGVDSNTGVAQQTARMAAEALRAKLAEIMGEV